MKTRSKPIRTRRILYRAVMNQGMLYGGGTTEFGAWRSSYDAAEHDLAAMQPSLSDSSKCIEAQAYSLDHEYVRHIQEKH